MIKNYTSQVPYEKSVMSIEKKLVTHGAMNILKLYENKKLSGLAFIISSNGRNIPFRLPARIDRVEKQLTRPIKKIHKGTYQRKKDQAERTAWKLLADWIDIQLSLVELDQVELIEIFMPYIYDHAKDQTLFEKFKNENLLIEYSQEAK